MSMVTRVLLLWYMCALQLWFSNAHHKCEASRHHCLLTIAAASPPLHAGLDRVSRQSRA